jgi:peptide chain release factor 2
MQKPGFWDDQQRAASTSAEHSRTTRKLEAFREIERDVADLAGLAGLSEEDESFRAELDEQLTSAEARLAELE